MINFLEKRFALSRKGSIDLLKGVLFTCVLNIVLMMPPVYVFLFLDDYLKPILNKSVSTNSSILYYTVLALFFMLIMFLVAKIQYRFTFSVVYEESANRRVSLAEKLRKLPLSFFAHKNLSDLTSTIMDDCTELEHTFSHAVPQLIASVLSLVFISVGLFLYNWQLSLALFWIVPLAFILIFLSKKIQYRGNKQIYEHKRFVSEKISEGLENIQEIKSYNKENDYLDKLYSVINLYEKQLISNELLAGAMVYSSIALLKLGLVSVIFVGVHLLSLGSVDLFTVLMFLLVASRIYNPIADVFNNMAALFFLDVRINRVTDMLNLDTQQGDVSFKANNFDLVFENVDFSYHKGEKVIDNVSFTAKQGQITALVGPSGGGKSTIAKLAARFWDADSGSVLLDGTNINTIDPEVLLENYSVVFQDVVLFNSSIMDNIRIGRANASDNDVIEAAKMAQCHDFISQMPDAYNSLIGENGDTLSGGERQRISIARALLKNAPIVLLDEATASLDVENETKIQIAISELVRNKTVLIIAHRMRTIANADKVIVLENGRVYEQGAPEYLLNKKGMFADMFKSKEKVS